MNKLFKLRHASKLVAFLATSMIVALSATASAAGTYGPSRPTKAWSPTVSGFPYVTFDSFTGVGNGIGNEQDFYRAVDVGRDSTWTNPLLNVPQGSDVEAQIYIHNNADSSLNASGVGVAHNVTVRVTIPDSTLAQSQTSTAYISASNATPQTIYDSMQITGANNGYFDLAYEDGTAQLHEQNGTTTNLTPTQESELINGGLNLGDQDGCFSYVQEITFKMKMQMPQYNILKQVRLPGQGPSDWQSSISATDGETLQYSIKFSNIGLTELQNVAIVDQIPNGLTVVPGSITVYTSNFPNGTTDISPNPIQENGRQLNLNIGNFLPLTQAELNAGDISGQIIYNATVTTADLTCGADTLVNNAYATPQGLGAIEDSASANVNKQCQTPPPKTPPTTPPATPTTPAAPTQLVNTGPGDVIAIFGLTTVVGAIAHRLFWVRRLARRG